jgi:hypothetical protein
MTPEETICEAIRNRRRLSFTYGGSRRVVDPYILGHDAEGRALLSAVQVSGGSGAGFRTFELAGIDALSITPETFFGNHPRYNPRDRLFARMLCRI